MKPEKAEEPQLYRIVNDEPHDPDFHCQECGVDYEPVELTRDGGIETHWEDGTGWVVDRRKYVVWLDE